jgi:hydroxymethylpyrimidine/phosphomethylpyrimidine kinase
VTPRTALSIAGSDSGGGAGLQADLRTFAAHRVHGTHALTAITAQNTTGVFDVVVLEPTSVVAQIEAVVSDFSVAAVKTGMLANAAIIDAVAELAPSRLGANLVVDPVLVSSTGHRLMDDDGIDSYRLHLFPRALIITPNLRETAVLTGRSLEALSTVEQMTDAAHELRALGVPWVVVKGGHLGVLEDGGGGESGSPDVVVGPSGTTILEAKRVETGNDHGTGCSLSAAIAANLALGMDPLASIRAAKVFVHAGLLGAKDWHLGAGHGPIDHLGWEST